MKWVIEGGGSIPLIKLFSREANCYQAGTEFQLLHSCICECFKNFLTSFFLFQEKKKKHGMARTQSLMSNSLLCLLPLLLPVTSLVV